MIRAISVPELADTWDDVVESFVHALFRSVSAGRFVYTTRDSFTMFDMPPNCIKVFEIGDA